MLDAGQWHKIGEMQMGFGVNYLKGITRSIDLITTLDASSTDYLYKDGSNNGEPQHQRGNQQCRHHQ